MQLLDPRACSNQGIDVADSDGWLDLAARRRHVASRRRAVRAGRWLALFPRGPPRASILCAAGRCCDPLQGRFTYLDVSSDDTSGGVTALRPISSSMLRTRAQDAFTARFASEFRDRRMTSQRPVTDDVAGRLRLPAPSTYVRASSEVIPTSQTTIYGINAAGCLFRSSAEATGPSNGAPVHLGLRHGRAQPRPRSRSASCPRRQPGARRFSATLTVCGSLRCH
jgi:hypothetical protein